MPATGLFGRFGSSIMARHSWLLLVLVVGPACIPDDPPDPTEPSESGAQEPTARTRVLVVGADRTCSEVREAVAPSRLTGRHSRGMLCDNLGLVLRADGSFHLEWFGCVGVYGTADGTWYVDPHGVALIPSRVDGALVEYPIRRLFLARMGGHYVLIPEADRDEFARDGPSGFTFLWPEAVLAAARRERANDAARPAGPGNAADGR